MKKEFILKKNWIKTNMSTIHNHCREKGVEDANRGKRPV